MQAYESFLQGWDPHRLSTAARRIGAPADQLLSIKHRPIGWSLKYSPPILLSQPGPPTFYEDWRVQVLTLGQQVGDRFSLGYRDNAVQLRLSDGSLMVIAEHETGPEIILWLMQNPAAAAAGFAAVAALAGLAAAPFGLTKSALDVLAAYLKLKGLYFERVIKANSTKAKDEQVIAITTEARDGNGARLLELTPLPMIDETLLPEATLENADHIAFGNLVSGATWQGVPPPVQPNQ